MGNGLGRNSREVWRYQRVWRSGPALRCEHGGSAEIGTYLVGCLIQGLGADHVVWGTDALWTGSPQWQIEGLRRLEIPEDMQKRFGFRPLGPADGPVKTAIFSGNSSRLYDYKAPDRWSKMDRFAALREQYLQSGSHRTNLRYGYVAV